MAEAAKEKRRLYKIFDKSKNAIPVVEKVLQENKRIYDETKRNTRKAVPKAKMFGEMLDEQDKKESVLRVAKQIVRNNKDVVGEGCIKDIDGKIVTHADKLLELL